MPTSYSNLNFALTLQDLIIENENGEATDIDKVYLHNCSNKTVYESSSLVKNQDSLFKNSYTATFNIPIDKDNKKDTKLIIYSNDLSKTHTTKDIHKRSDTAVISLSYKDKNNRYQGKALQILYYISEGYTLLRSYFSAYDGYTSLIKYRFYPAGSNNYVICRYLDLSIADLVQDLITGIHLVV